LYDHNIEQPTISADDLLLRRMQLHLRLEAWKSSLPLSWKTVSLAEIEHNSSIELELIRVPILFSIHYRRAQLLINRPVLTHALRTWVLAAIPLSTVFTGELVTIANADFEAAKELVGIIHVLMLTDNDIVQRHGIWFLANYSGMLGLPFCGQHCLLELLRTSFRSMHSSIWNFAKLHRPTNYSCCCENQP